MQTIRIITLDNGTSLKINIEEINVGFGGKAKVVRLSQSDTNKVLEMTLSQPEAIILAKEIINEFNN